MSSMINWQAGLWCWVRAHPALSTGLSPESDANLAPAPDGAVLCGEVLAPGALHQSPAGKSLSEKLKTYQLNIL